MIEDLRKSIDALERRILKKRAGARVTLDRAAFRIALVEAYTAGKLRQAKAELSTCRKSRRAK